ncbi:MAG: glycosyltransferase [Candidatus Gastranaerophilales bacterium]|nr:glycosyltransferase [Candidatus Gastranaerophilales bacterium]
MNLENPKVTVLMPVYNSEKYLREAIKSILNQTFYDFEFLIINDGSTDKSVDIIESFNDPRIRLVHNKKNLGLIASLNKGLDLCKGEYIARMDADDISLPTRLEKQVEFLDSNSDTVICSSLIKTFGDVNPSVFRYPENHESIKSTLLFKNSIAHPAVMMKKSAIKGLYFDPEYKHAEDYELWVRASKYLKLYNMQEVLLLYRMHAEQVSQHHLEAQSASSRKIMLSQLEDLGVKPTEEELELHKQIGTGKIQPSNEFVNRAENWLIKLKDINKKTSYYSESAFSYVVAEHWFLVCIKASKLGIWSCRKFFYSPLSKKNNLSLKSKLKLVYKCLKQLN